MRRLLLLACMLAIPSIARADAPVLLTPFYGCSATGCYQVQLVPYLSGPNDGTSRFLYTISCAAASTVCGDWLFERVELYDVQGNTVYSVNHGSPGEQLYGDPSNGALTYSVYDQALNSGNGGTTAYSVPLTTVPEPVTIALLGTGLAVVGFARRRRRLDTQRAT